MAQTNKILNHSVGASFGAGEELFVSVNARENAELIAATFDNPNGAGSTIQKGAALCDNANGGTDGLKKVWLNGVIAGRTGLCILIHDVVLDGTSGGQVVATAVVASTGVRKSLVVSGDAGSPAADSNFTDVMTHILFV